MPRHPVPDPFAAGAESVWDYPRPPTLRRCGLPIQVILGGTVACETTESWQVLETSHPPTYYLPRVAFSDGVLSSGAGSSVCEWKGAARYIDLVAGGRRAPRAGWYYPNPSPGFEVLADHIAVYAGRVDACFVAGERVTPQPGEFYGGWITAAVAGPFKGIPGSSGW